MNRNAIKFVAAFTMFLDHFAQYLLPFDSLAYIILRSIGRIAFVLFAYMIVEGFFHTKNLRNYYLRLFGFAAVIELFIIGYYLYSDVNFIMQVNVIWPLVFGLTGLILFNQKSIWLRLLVIPIVFLAEFINIPYGSYGTLMILFFALYRHNKITQLMFIIGLNLIYIAYPLMIQTSLIDYVRYGPESWYQWFSLLGFIFIFLYNHKKGKLNTKWFFYIFYPIHLGIIYLIGIFM